MKVLSDAPLFFLANTYTTGLSGRVMENIYTLTLKKRFGGHTDIDEVGIPITNQGLVLPCGCSSRWQAE